MKWVVIFGGRELVAHSASRDSFTTLLETPLETVAGEKKGRARLLMHCVTRLWSTSGFTENFNTKSLAATRDAVAIGGTVVGQSNNIWIWRVPKSRFKPRHKKLNYFKISGAPFIGAAWF